MYLLQKNWNSSFQLDIFEILNLNSNALIYAISKSISIKAKYINNDEKELLKNSSSRAILNFGHTFGHALETLYKYNKKLTHGEAISIGMMIATTLSYKLNYLSFKDLIKIKNHFITNALPIEDKEMYNKKSY